MEKLVKNKQYYKFCMYGFLKNLRFFDAFFILFLLEKNISYTQIGILYAAREIFINIFEIPSGVFADTFGRKSSLAGSFVVYILSFTIFYFSSNFWLFLLAFLLYGLADAFRSGTHKGMIMDYLRLNNAENLKIKYYGHTRSWSQKGSAISSIIAGILVFYSGKYQNIFLYSIIPYILNFFLIISYPKELSGSFIGNNKQSKLKFANYFKLLFDVLKKPNVLKIINTSAAHTAYLKAIKDYIQIVMLNLALIIPLLINFQSEKRNGLIIGILYFLIYLITSFSSKQSSKIVELNFKNISLITLLLGFIFGILSGIFYINNLWILSFVSFTSIYIIENIRKPILTGFISDNVPNEILTSVISAQSLLSTIITALLAFFFGLFTDFFGLGFSILIISSFLSIFSIIFSFISK
ncbi:MAG: MFS transporter [Bacteroidales bacterium]|nr:MFS transporter [Bacteroidales bacterium]MBN2756137.1 MFS transporter [Bacteroidales bacterium]